MLEQTHLRAICAAVTRDVTHDLREIFRVLDDVHMAKHLEVRELGRYTRDLRAENTISKIKQMMSEVGHTFKEVINA